MDTNKINKCLEHITNTIEYKNSLIEKYKGSRALLYIQSEINTLKQTVKIITDLAEEIQEQRELTQKISELEEELLVANNTNELLTRKIWTSSQTEDRPTINKLKQWKQKRMQSTNN